MRKLLVGSAFALLLAGCTSHIQTVDQQLTSALAGEPVTVAQQNQGMLGGMFGGSGTITLTSSADYLYPSGGFELRPGAPVLSKMVPTFRQFQHTTITVIGYTDDQPVGPQLQRMGISDNTELSLKRASEVVAYFQSQGVNPSLLNAKGYGDSDPVGPDSTQQGRAQNRRIVIVLNGDGT